MLKADAAQAVNLVYFTQLVNVVGSGAYARDIVAVVGGAQDTVWLTSVIPILTVVLSSPVSQAADFWGRKWFLVCLTATGCVGSIVVSRANSMPMAIAGFTVSGLSFGAQPLLHAVTSEVLPRTHRSYAQASVNVSAPMGAIFGLYVGGALTRNTRPENFRIYWYIAAAIYASSALIVALLYNPPPRQLQLELTSREKIQRLDWVGYFLLTSGLLLFCLGLSWSQNPYPWSNVHVLATFLIGVALTIGLVVYQWRFKHDGMFHHGLFRDRNFPLAVFCIFCEGISFFCANTYFAFGISMFHTPDPLQVGLHYSIAFYSYAFFAVVAGTIRAVIIVAFSALLIFNVLMATVTPTTSVANLWGYPVILGVGLGFCLTALMTAAQFSAPIEHIAVCSGLMIGVRSLGGSVGLAIYNAIFNSALSTNLAPKIAAAVLPLGLPETSLGPFISSLTANNATAIAQIPGVNNEIIHAGGAALLDAFSVAFRYVWVAAGAFALPAIIGKVLPTTDSCAIIGLGICLQHFLTAAFFIYNPTNEFNTHIDAPVETDTINLHDGVDELHESEQKI
ncbi:uncharacterized protein A1O9_09273 [Exophiala aquamarina CBS 119918]|uniref:Major facilitator superfamily (MFS) profile domain-containing protein n=1 Tax=Exophiala aquamarina CBS 119918 TaxID=1182545 RepID=A0A072P4S8_9EURO|nr:uncharacterized protein A1O9_09273 [Exophiala aquamarina CBS 119918]KEF54831.1 hypothetical protein A1O9_09273 [Exophiala aquamarina CBS 119918]